MRKYAALVFVVVFFSCSFHNGRDVANKEQTLSDPKPSIYEEDLKAEVVKKFTIVEYSAVSKIPQHRSFYLFSGDDLYEDLEPAVVLEASFPVKEVRNFNYPEVPTLMSGKIMKKKIVVYFPFDSAKLTEDEKLKIKVFLNKIGRNSKLKVEGFTDKIGSKEYNDKLALKRAESVARFIRMLRSDISLSVNGKGKCCYISEEDDENRRVEVNEE